MTTPIKIIIDGQLSSLVVKPASPPLNAPPVWDSQPVVFFAQGTTSTYDINNIVSDPDGDTITFSINSASASLPSGVTWDAGTGIFSYDGSAPVAATTGHVITLNDGQETTDSNAFTVNISNDWPYRWPQVRGMYAISDYSNVLGNSNYTSWTYNSDLLIFQALYPTANWVEAAHNYISPNRSNYPNCKIVNYIIPMWSIDQEENRTFYLNSHRRVQRDAINSYSAQAEWYLKHPTTGNYLYGSNDQQETIMTNMSNVCPVVGGETFISAYVDTWFNKHTSGANDTSLVSVTDGIYFDGLDANNRFPTPRDGYLGSNYTSPPDYNVDGVANDSQNNYREGSIDLAEQFQSVATTSHAKTSWYVCSNGARDYATSFGATPTDHAWYQRMGSLRIIETAYDRLRIVYDSGADGWTTQAGMANRVWDHLVRHAAVSNELLIPEFTSGVKPYILVDYPIIQGGTGLVAGDLGDDAWKLQEAIWALCMSTEFMMYGCLINKQQPSPDIDLYIVDTGNPSATRSLGGLNSDWSSFVPRAPDSTEGGAEWYITEFENGFVWFNASDPSNNTVWPQTGNNATLSADFPTPPSGKKGQWINSSTYTNTTYGLSAQGYASSRYDGSDATSITAGPYEGGWIQWVDI